MARKTSLVSVHFNAGRMLVAKATVTSRLVGTFSNLRTRAATGFNTEPADRGNDGTDSVI
jgi:hypothetical protein